ncbi:MAG: MltA domain-containing protein [Gallionella sp.]|nr:MltA domain-containing protein [Gallionella sp.]MDD4959542.1 MltA domain-containing protein [Gallionella sp.]
MISLYDLNRLFDHGWLACLVLTACVPAPIHYYTVASARPNSAPNIRHSQTRAPRVTYNRWQQLPDWQSVDLRTSWTALLNSCAALKHQRDWRRVCSRAEQQSSLDNEQIRTFFESEFTPQQLVNADGSSKGLVTGYYEPKLKGSHTRTARFRYPLYAIPEALLDSQAPIPTANHQPYYSRAQINAGIANLAGQELFWVEDEVELFFLQIQGSGRIELPNGQFVRVGYAGDNGHPYRSIGKKLVEMGELSLDQASMWDIQDWGLQNPERFAKLLNSNPRYTFFRELPATASAPIGALGIPLTEGYSIAVDPQSIPLGVPVFLATTFPNSDSPLNRLVFAQDAGIAIKGKVRADFFWGFGEEAKTQASRMKQTAKMWVLRPKPANQRVAHDVTSPTQDVN